MICILTEKPSAARNFAKALGGQSGTFHGEEYTITHARGHLFGLSTNMGEQVPESRKSFYTSWSVNNLPWDEKEFIWKRDMIKGASSVYQDIRKTIRGASEVIIATDDDPSGEGELLAWEILDAAKWRGKTTRMYFTDETPKSIQNAFVKREVIPSMEKDGDYVKAWARSRFDFLTMQYTRMATVLARQKGHSYILREGRLKSPMVHMVGKQEEAYKNYVKKPFYEARYRDENGNIYQRDPETADRKDKKSEVSLKELLPSDVVLDKEEKRQKPPDPLLNLAQLSSILATKGYAPKSVLQTYQQMYEEHIVSYPRTEDKTITPEQFYELLPHVDSIAKLLDIDPSVLTHRVPRKTHVQAKGAHGANRPGPNVPKSLPDLASKYGAIGKAIYEEVAKSTLAMFAENYEYLRQKGHIKDHPEFIGVTNVPVKPGYKIIYDATFSMKDEKDDKSNQKALGKRAESFIHEGANKRPQRPTMKWLTRELEKYNVGTGATRTSTLADITKGPLRTQLLTEKKGVLSLAPAGEISYRLIQNSMIADVKTTETLFNQMESVGKFQLAPEDILKTVKELVVYDRNIMIENQKKIGAGKMAEERIQGIYAPQNIEISFKKTWGNHTFTEEEGERLLNGEEISFESKTKNDTPCTVKGRLSQQEYEGNHYWGFETTDVIYDDSDRIQDIFLPTGDVITFKRTWGGHTFTEEEINALLNGEEIRFQMNVRNTPFQFTGRLAEQEYEGRTFWGFKSTERQSLANDRAHGVFAPTGQSVSFKKEWGGHTFSDDEIQALLNGDTVSFTGSSGNQITGCLAQQEYKGNRFWGFKRDEEEARKGYITGTFEKKEVTFKDNWGGHKFTEKEIEDLLAGKEITFQAKSSRTLNEYTARGSLKQQTYNGRKFWGFKPNFKN